MTDVATATTGDDEQHPDPLVRGLKTDRPEDDRSCPHDCHGSLSLTDDDRVLCETCRCTPDGVYLPPDDNSNESDGDWACSQRGWFYPSSGGVSSTVNPWGPRDKNGSVARYRVSQRVIMPGGFEEVYPQERTSRDDSLI